MIFQAYGAGYTFSDAIRHLVSHGTKRDSDALRNQLVTTFGGTEAVLYRKGRAALAEAIRLATGGSGTVAISGLTCYSVVQAVEAAGCTPVFLDITEDDLHFTGAHLEKAVTQHDDLKAVVVQNMLGLPADIASIEKVARQHGVLLIEDLAHSAGVQYADGRRAGTVGDMTMLSFGRDKAIDTVNGGALVVKQNNSARPTQMPRFDEQLRDRLYPFIAWTTRALYPVKIGPYIMALAIKLGIVIRSADGDVDTTEQLPHWQAKRAREQLLNFEKETSRRRDLVNKYVDLLDAPIPVAAKSSGAAPLRVPLTLQNRDKVVAALKANGIIATDIWYDIPVSPQRFYSKVSYPEAECPVATSVAARLINLPTHRGISESDVEEITSIVNKVGTV